MRAKEEYRSPWDGLDFSPVSSPTASFASAPTAVSSEGSSKDIYTSASDGQSPVVTPIPTTASGFASVCSNSSPGLSPTHSPYESSGLAGDSPVPTTYTAYAATSSGGEPSDPQSLSATPSPRSPVSDHASNTFLRSAPSTYSSHVRPSLARLALTSSYEESSSPFEDSRSIEETGGRAAAPRTDLSSPSRSPQPPTDIPSTDQGSSSDHIRGVSTSQYTTGQSYTGNADSSTADVESPRMMSDTERLFLAVTNVPTHTHTYTYTTYHLPTGRYEDRDRPHSPSVQSSVSSVGRSDEGSGASSLLDFGELDRHFSLSPLSVRSSSATPGHGSDGRYTGSSVSPPDSARYTNTCQPASPLGSVSSVGTGSSASHGSGFRNYVTSRLTNHASRSTGNLSLPRKMSMSSIYGRVKGNIRRSHFRRTGSSVTSLFDNFSRRSPGAVSSSATSSIFKRG